MDIYIYDFEYDAGVENDNVDMMMLWRCQCNIIGCNVPDVDHDEVYTTEMNSESCCQGTVVIFDHLSTGDLAKKKNIIHYYSTRNMMYEYYHEFVKTGFYGFFPQK